ncbi:MAG: flagellar protein [Ligilactobacillus ruminis]|nr:flagellar protein [Ligilactobacillus ruminis]MDD5958382.1 flagellar protein [Ligilactobacillus ruminis]
MMRISKVGLENQNHATIQAQKKRNQQDFGNELEKAHLKISNHAQKRMSARKLNLADDDYVQISKAVSELQEKGSRESLLLYKDMGLIANVQNRTIITAMDRNEIGTVTNIDSTKFIK